MSFICLLIIILMIVSVWKIFEKAGQPGWASIIPIYNIIVMLQIARKPIWWILLFLIPVVGVVMAILMMVELAKTFGKSTLFGVGLALLGFIFFPLLAFGDAEYQG
jgi:nicotinamide riboside transporter PnuC